ncbi:MAG: hypothetical protein IKP87_05680 [Victivallales bacterium]|nr:hypothetical protein [Victivallales bacterium]
MIAERGDAFLPFPAFEAYVVAVIPCAVTDANRGRFTEAERLADVLHALRMDG